MKRVTKVLIANRGEIAVRIERTFKRLGIITVAVYSTPDLRALHVVLSDEAFHIGPAPAVESYLNIEAIVAAARKSGSDAVHPGYGFLAENADFAQAVIDAGLTWIGPSPTVIRLLGDKMRAKEVAQRAGVSTVPGYQDGDLSPERIAAEAEAIGYPVMIKAAAGGGGKGMRAVTKSEDLAPALASARREALAAFADDRVFIEKLIERPRHIEFQVFFDSHGNGIHLGERECSIQRRHQKVLEEAPSTVLTAELRAAMGADAVRVMREAAYVNAGTVEFLVDGEQYFFLEVNTRIQVEHPVTEAVTGLDLIELQVAVARGEPLPLSQNDVRLDGHAIEVRIYAEDPCHGFLPSAGRIDSLKAPMGEGIRNDLGIYSGFEVGTQYDPMLAKLIAHGRSRSHTLRRLQEALSNYDVSGLATNLGFLRWLVRQPDLKSGNVDNTFLDRTWSPAALTEMLPLEIGTAVAILFDLLKVAGDPWSNRSAWRLFGFDRVHRLGFEGMCQVVTVTWGSDRRFTSQFNGRALSGVVLKCGTHRMVLLCDDRVLNFEYEPGTDSLTVTFEGMSYRVDVEAPPQADAGMQSGQASASIPVTPMPATVIRVAVTAGQTVKAHEPLVVLEAMKMEHVIEAIQDGVVAEILVREGDLVAAGAPVVRMESL